MHTLYDPEITPVALRYMARAGLTNEEMARELGVTRRTLQTWQNDYKAVERALKEGKKHVDNLVEESLLSRALGMDYEEVTLKQVFPDPNAEEPVNGATPVVTEPPVIERTVKKKKLAPDVTACIFWLKNRRPETWRDVQEHKFSGQVKAKRDRDKGNVRPLMSDPKALSLANDLARRVATIKDAQNPPSN
jgi:transcriptional regulator with XRE-family HTH domain